MEWRPARPDVQDFEFDEENTEHLSRHDVSPDEVHDVLHGKPRYFLNQPGRTATHIMVGPDRRGRVLLIAMLETGIDAKWRPVTGWESRAARAIYNELEARQ